jgi:cell division protein ZipA
LSYGPYSIFHREREDGKSLLYVASMMEPGSFDLARMDQQDFAGISLFGVVPGPLDAPSTFDLVLAVGRGLAGRLAGQLQDEQGSTLTAQRILNLREELVHFEHRNRRLRRS